MGLAYPGETANVRDIMNLAAQYKDAAVELGQGLSKLHRIPQRLLALHSIELYLNALLLSKGLDHKAIRDFEHDLGERTRIAVEAGLVLRKRTAAHLATLSASREYLIIRYGPELSATLSQINRVMATLDELSQKVRRMLRAKS
ncbi:hypothetical protein [Ensifer sp. SSB1]|jgi:hypothetical protein|uniref:hypothetical protein n=1 Tax=Ensifer sp. SSB1 TaxID=2795385 RepID=UPI001A55617D|nr:hypothetical protein [Ensifer sp. SSB1]MBK5570990.1 hypothetical protein [Ensifer sp. SSB1]